MGDAEASEESKARKAAVLAAVEVEIAEGLPTVDSDDEGGDSPKPSPRPLEQSVAYLDASGRGDALRTMLGGASQSVLDMTEHLRTVREQVRTHRPPDEVVCSVNEMLGHGNASAASQRRVAQLVGRLMEDSDAEIPPELAVFSAHLESLLGTIFAQVAEYVDALAEGSVKPDDECTVLSGLLIPSVMEDIVCASRLSLRSYHQHCRALKRLSKGRRKLNGRGGAAAGNSTPRHGMHGRRLSSLAVPGMLRAGSVASTFSVAFAEGTVPNTSGNTAPKRRPDTRIDRRASCTDPQLSPGEQGLMPSPRSQIGQTRRQTIGRSSPGSGNVQPRSPHAPAPSPLLLGGPFGSMSGSVRDAPEFARSVASFNTGAGVGRESSSMNRTSPREAKELEDKLGGLSTLQFFDIIVETLCVCLCIKYEQQLLELTHDGDTAGAKRAAEWVTARIIDELYNDGIDPAQPLCQQLMLCTEGVAHDSGEYCWRRAAGVDPDVACVVWGVETPDDVASMTLQRKDPTRVWFEWGTFAQPGVRCADGSHWSCPRLNPEQYGWRLGRKDIAESLGLKRVDPDVGFRRPSFLDERPGDSLLDTVYYDGGQAAAAPEQQHAVAERRAERRKERDAAGVPGLTLSAPPEGSCHAGGTKRKPHIRPPDLAERRHLERMYQRNQQDPRFQGEPEQPGDWEEDEEADEESEEAGENESNEDGFAATVAVSTPTGRAQPQRQMSQAPQQQQSGTGSFRRRVRPGSAGDQHPRSAAEDSNDRSYSEVAGDYQPLQGPGVELSRVDGPRRPSGARHGRAAAEPPSTPRSAKGCCVVL